MTDQILALDRVTFTVGSTTLLNALTCAPRPAGMTGVVGQNGSGKSTLLKLFARQLPPTTGEITVLGRSAKSWPKREFARLVAYMPQHTPITTGLKARELVELGRYPWHGALGRFTSADRKKVDEAMALTETHAFAERMLDSLSGGERQRVWLAMMLAQDARLLLLDEPISALDAAHQVGILKLVREITRAKDVAAVVVLHDINLTVRFCDDILALKHGRLIGHGPASEFMTPDRLAEVYDVAMGVIPHPDSRGAIAYVRA
jgi:ferric hydroxamate transport system ATP-binding protein